MIERETDPELINRIANSEGVAEYIRPDGATMDWTELASLRPAESGVVILSNGKDALSVFEMVLPGSYQGHILFSKSCRGRRAVETGRAMVAWMFERGAQILWGDVPTWNLAARWFCRQIGFARCNATSDEDSEILIARAV